MWSSYVCVVSVCVTPSPRAAYSRSSRSLSHAGLTIAAAGVSGKSGISPIQTTMVPRAPIRRSGNRRPQESKYQGGVNEVPSAAV